MKTSIKALLLFALIFLSFNKLKSQNWEDQATGLLPLDYGVFGISVVDENIVWAIAFDQNVGNTIPNNHITKILKTIDGGINWELYDVEEAEGRISFDIVAFDENTAFITTQDFNNGSGRGIFKTEDGGINWDEKFNHPSGGVWIRFFNSEDAVIINRASIATSQDGGESWQTMSSIPPFDNDEYTILSTGNNSCEVVGDHIWFGTNKGRVYRSNDKGHTWEVSSLPVIGNGFIQSVAFKDTLNGIALNTSNSTFTRTNDGGLTWQAFSSSPNISLSNITYVPGTEGTFLATSDINVFSVSQRSAYSTDFGVTWETINSNIPFGPTQFISQNVGWSSRGVIDSGKDPAIFKWEGDIFVATEELSLEHSYDIFPNPFYNNLNVNSQALSRIEFKIYNSLGQVTHSGKINSNNLSLNLEELNAGIYYLSLNLDGEIKTEKIVKSN